MFVGHSFPEEVNPKKSDVVIAPCRSYSDCIRLIRSLPCGPRTVSCVHGICACNPPQIRYS